jgi:hypothetical protein
MKIRKSFIISLVIGLSSCATHETTYWEHGKKGTVIVHHVRKNQRGTADRTEMLTSKMVTPDEIKVYDLGRMPDGNGGMHEAHRFYRVVQSEHFDLRLPPAKDLKPTGPKTVFTPPTYSPAPKDQRINDAVADANQAKDKLDEARGKIEKQLADDNNLRGELQTAIDDNQRLHDQLSAAMSTPQRSPTPSTQSDASKAGQAAGSDPLAQWGSRVAP